MKFDSIYNILNLVFLLLFASLCFSGCSYKSNSSAIVANDNSQKENKTDTKTQKIKIASFAPSNTELIYSLGAQDCLIGTCTECKYPKHAINKPKVGSFIAAKYEKLAALKPDLSLFVSGQDSLASQLNRRNYATKLLKNDKLSDITLNLNYIGTICGKKDRAQFLTDKFNQAILEFKNIIANKKRPQILFCIWLNPSMCVGGVGFLNDVITVCGATNSIASFKSSYPKLTAEKIISTNPEFVILPFEAQKDNQISRPPWSSLNAVKSSQVFYLPEAKYDQLSRPTLRIVSGLHWLAVRVHPEESQRLNAWLEKYEPQLIKQK